MKLTNWILVNLCYIDSILFDLRYSCVVLVVAARHLYVMELLMFIGTTYMLCYFSGIWAKIDMTAETGV